jgi:chemotaxis protein methyltransferase CheR
MAPKLKNVLEDIAADCLNSALQMRYDICTCAVCKTDMLAYILSHVPAKYVTTETGALHAVMQQNRVEFQAQISRATIEAIDVVSKDPRHELKENRNETFQLLLDKIKEDRGCNFRHYHQELLKRRVAIRMRVKGATSYADYLRLLMNTPEEYDKLFEVLCINVSEFFRDADVWTSARPVLEEMLRGKAADRTATARIWSAGCANGEEPHSIAIMIDEILRGASLQIKTEVVATDIDKKSLALALKGEYGKDAVRNVDKERLAANFDFEGGMYRVKPGIRKLLTCRYLDLTSNDYVDDCDAVFCRNVFIYFDRNLQEQLLMKFYKALKPGGYLIMGKSETLIREAAQIFEEVDANARIYRRK